MPKWEAWKSKKDVFALYVLQFKRFRWSEKSIENGGPNYINKSSKLKPWASKVAFVEIFVDCGKLDFLMFFRSAKRRAPITNKSFLGWLDRPGNKIFDAIPHLIERASFETYVGSVLCNNRESTTQKTSQDQCKIILNFEAKGDSKMRPEWKHKSYVFDLFEKR